MAKAKAAKPKTTAAKSTAAIQWSEALMTDICDHLTTGKSLIEISRLQGYPSSDSMYRQMAKDPDFAARIARAREAGQDHEADAIVAMADMATAEDWQVVKLRMAARQWRAAKLAPKRYGDKVEVSGGLEVEERRTVDIRVLPVEQREILRQTLLEAVQRLEEPDAIEGEFEVRNDEN